ncbi:ABC transporter substrate-binding protein [Actinophytocola algeriensis]|uniref:NitT/TauT family transport system substrate-binding protein n=1 Tax=Actinophytocola algeriensis TaxID=1768010 RepID=A0A7W7VF17_9PSEU|nr:ABC transporter substrate-binding protein [Actinophytocola algeriensis]MBB4907827.1 NitT/TauT family transport system substrate-binding protein [Actinophytocola algeriensis]MBE1479857.1 NitT/TauT family transport system substrate-binding protein [Actinophytocola algeriensis]
MRRRLAVLAALALFASGCGSAEPSSSGGQDEVKVGLISILDVAPIYLGKEKGFFAERNIELTLQPAEGGTETVPSVLSGNQQFGFSNVVTLLLAQAQGLPVKVVSNGTNSTGVDGADFGALMVGAGSAVQSVKDLAGKKVAVNTFQNVVELAVRASALKAGIDPESIEFVKLPFPDMPAALSEGRADAVFVVEPFQQIVLSQGGRALASSYVDTAPDLSVAMYFTSKQLLGENPDLVKRFTEAMNESLAYADAHPDEVRQILPTYTKIGPEIIPELVLPKWPADINTESVAAIAELAEQEKVLPKKPDIADLMP